MALKNNVLCMRNKQIDLLFLVMTLVSMHSFTSLHSPSSIHSSDYLIYYRDCTVRLETYTAYIK